MIYQDYAEYVPWLYYLRGLGISSYLEIGTAGGYSIAAAREILPDTRLVTLNIRDEAEIKFVDVEYVIGDSHEIDLGPFDAIFIDGDHTEGSVSKDFELWWPRARHVLGFHDVTAPAWPAVARQWMRARLHARAVRFTSDRDGCSSIGVLMKASAFPRNLPREVGPTAFEGGI